MTEEEVTEARRRKRALGVWYALVVVLLIQTMVGVLAFVSLRKEGADAAHQAQVAAQAASQAQIQAICPLTAVFLDTYHQLEKAGKLTDAGRVVRDRMQSYADVIGCPKVP